MIVKHTVTFLSPGTMIAEVSNLPIESWDIKKAIELSRSIIERHGAKPYGFTFQKWGTMPDVIDDDGNSFKVEQKLLEKSGTYFLGGYLETYDEVVARDDSKEEILRWNMKANELWVLCINSNSWKVTEHFTEKDVLLNDDGNIVKRGDDEKFVAYRKAMSAIPFEQR